MDRLEEIKNRKAELRGLLSDESQEVNLDEIKTEIDNLNAEEKQINEDLEKTAQEEQKESEETRSMAKEIEERKVVPNEIKEERNMEDNKIEVRNSRDYINAYAEYIKTGKEEELRAVTGLATTNVDGGTIAVPDMVYDEIKTAWENEGIMSLVNKANLKGNIKVNFEISGSDAVVHTERGSAVAEEELTEGIVTLIPSYIKKWISITDEIMSLRGEEFLTYIYRELSHKIVKKMADTIIGQIVALPQTATATSPSANKVSLAPANNTIATAFANLSDECENPVIVMNKLTYAEFKKVQYDNNYAADIFEGLTVKFNNSLPAYSAASTGDVYCVVGDFKQGALANFPNGDAVEYTFDQLSRKKEDLVEVLGKEYVGLGVVADKAFALVTKPTTI